MTHSKITVQEASWGVNEVCCKELFYQSTSKLYGYKDEGATPKDEKDSFFGKFLHSCGLLAEIGSRKVLCCIKYWFSIQSYYLVKTQFITFHDMAWVWTACEVLKSFDRETWVWITTHAVVLCTAADSWSESSMHTICITKITLQKSC